MTSACIDVGVVLVRRKLNSAWAEHTIQPYAVLPAIPAAAPGSPLGRSGEDEYLYAGAAQIVLHSSATGNYRDNLTAPRPSLWVFLQTDGVVWELSNVTADPYEGEALTEGFGGVVEAVAMPSEVEARLRSFVEEFHVDRPFFKRQRDDLHRRKRKGDRSMNVAP